jgi:hypothetical protein
MKLNLYDGTATLIDSILNRDNGHKQVQFGTTKMRLEVADVLEFESTPNKSRRAKIEIFGRPQWE